MRRKQNQNILLNPQNNKLSDRRLSSPKNDLVLFHLLVDCVYT